MLQEYLGHGFINNLKIKHNLCILVLCWSLPLYKGILWVRTWLCLMYSVFVSVWCSQNGLRHEDGFVSCRIWIEWRCATYVNSKLNTAMYRIFQPVFLQQRCRVIFVALRPGRDSVQTRIAFKKKWVTVEISTSILTEVSVCSDVTNATLLHKFPDPDPSESVRC
jgi:hypothetical protein